MQLVLGLGFDEAHLRLARVQDPHVQLLVLPQALIQLGLLETTCENARQDVIVSARKGLFVLASRFV